MPKGTRVSPRHKAAAPGARAVSLVRKYFPQVNHVIDATKPEFVEVTPKDVKASKRKVHSECAMAVASRRARDLDGVIISISAAYMVKGDTATRFTIPPTVGREIVSFDRSGDFEPGIYQLSVPGHLIGSNKPTGPKVGKGRPRRTMHMTTNVRSVLGSDKVV